MLTEIRCEFPGPKCLRLGGRLQTHFRPKILEELSYLFKKDVHSLRSLEFI
jgi:hypothetical protein